MTAVFPRQPLSKLFCLPKCDLTEGRIGTIDGVSVRDEKAKIEVIFGVGEM